MNAGLNDSKLNASSFMTGRSFASHDDASSFAKLSLNRRSAAMDAPWSSSASNERMVSWDTRRDWLSVEVCGVGALDDVSVRSLKHFGFLFEYKLNKN